MKTNSQGGITYFERWGFSINEGRLPNIHMSWRDGRFYFYTAFWLFKRVRCHFHLPLPFKVKRHYPAGW